MSSFNRISGIVITACMLFASCSQRTVTRIESISAPCPRTISSESDTVSYVVAFNDTSEREGFISSFNQFLKKYPFINVLEDTVRDFIRIQILPVQDTVYQALTKVEQTQIVEDIIEETISEVSEDVAEIPTDSTHRVVDSLIPEFGGVVKIYLPRKSVDPLFCRFFNTYPFSKNDTSLTDGTVLFVADSSARKITLKLNGKIVNADKRTLTALDFIDAWTSLLKKQPAEGYALFRNVLGVKEFIAGNEATVRGFAASDENTITLRLAEPDSMAISRLRSRYLIDNKLKIGLYHLNTVSNSSIDLLASKPVHGPDTPLLEKIVLYTGGDPNSLLSFSLNKYDGVVLTSVNDLEYARRNLSTNASLQEIPGERYFLSCASENDTFRRFLKISINAGDLLHNVIKAEGEPIKAVTINDIEVPNIQMEGTESIAQNKSFRILYCKSDPISKIIAEKLLAILSQAKIGVHLAPADEFEYQRNLILRDYDCAVGWVPQNILHNTNEQLRLASVFFNDQTDVFKRLQDNSEIPLFAIKRYLLKKNDLHLYKNTIQGLYRKTVESEPQPATEN